jgi:hypothetical protein
MKKRYLVIPNSRMSSGSEIRTKSLFFFFFWILYRIKFKKQALVWDTTGWVDQSEYRCDLTTQT